MDEFRDGLKTYNCNFTEDDVKLIFNHFDINTDGKVSYDEFTAILFSESYEDRQAIVDKAFTKLEDTDKSD